MYHKTTSCDPHHISVGTAEWSQLHHSVLQGVFCNIRCLIDTNILIQDFKLLGTIEISMSFILKCPVPIFKIPLNQTLLKNSMNRSFQRCFTNVCYRFLFHTFGLSLDWLIRDSYIESWFLYLSHHIYLLSLVSK